MIICPLRPSFWNLSETFLNLWWFFTTSQVGHQPWSAWSLVCAEVFEKIWALKRFCPTWLETWDGSSGSESKLRTQSQDALSSDGVLKNGVGMHVSGTSTWTEESHSHIGKEPLPPGYCYIYIFIYLNIYIYIYIYIFIYTHTYI